MSQLRFSLTAVPRVLLQAGALALCLGALGCQNYRDQLSRGQGYYEQNQYESALAVWRNLESNQGSLSRPEMVRYCYLRGMTDYRLGYNNDARYWLGLAKAALIKAQAAEGGQAMALQEDEAQRLEETLTELNNKVFGLEAADDTSPQALGDKCEWTSDCDSGFACQEGVCVQADGPEVAEGAEEPAPVEAPPAAPAEAAPEPSAPAE